MGDEGAGALPRMADHLGRTEREERAEAGGGNPMPAVARGPLPPSEEQSRQEGQEDELRVQRQEAHDVLEGVAALREAVQGLVEREVHGEPQILGCSDLALVCELARPG